MDTFISLYYGGEFTHEGTNKTYQLIYFYGRYSILTITMHNKCIQICGDPNFKLFFVMEYWIFRLISQRSKSFLLNCNYKKYDNIRCLHYQATKITSSNQSRFQIYSHSSSIKNGKWILWLLKNPECVKHHIKFHRSIEFNANKDAQ